MWPSIGFCTDARSARQVHRICNDVLHRCDDRPFDPSGRNHASDEFADVASDHCKPFYVRL